MVIRYLFILLSVFSYTPGVGQTDSIFSLPGDQQQEAIFHIYDSYEWQPAPRLAVMEPLAAESRKQGRKDLEEMIWSLIWVDKFNLIANRDSVFEMQYMQTLIEEARKKGWPRAEAECRFRLGLMIFGWQRFGPGMEMVMQSYEYLKRHGWTSPYAKCLLIQNLAEAYYAFGDYQTAITYLREALDSELPVSSAGYPYKSLNTIGLCHMNLLQLDSAIHYFSASYDMASLHQDSFWMALTTGNIGGAYYKLDRKDEAIPYLETDYLESIRLGVYGSAVNASGLLAAIELERGNIEQAEAYMDFARTYIDTSLEARLSFYENLHRYHKIKGEDRLALRYADSVFVLKRRKELERDRHILAQARMKTAYEEYDRQITTLKTARKHQVLLRNSSFAILLLSSLVTYIWFRSVQRRRRAEKQRLQEAETELQRYIRSLLEKNELIQSLRQRIESETTPDASDRSAEIAQLTQSSILTEEDWKHFRKLFDEVYPGFLIRLRDKLGELTPAETRILVLAKLQVAQKDMGDMLGISYNSIRTSRYRLRKKLNLPEEGSLEELVENI